LTNEPDRGKESGYGNHMTFPLALQACADAWSSALVGACDGLLAPSDLGVVNVASDFRRELFTGDAVINVALTRIGTSSVSLRAEIVQFAQSAVRVSAVLVRVDAHRQHSVPLSDAQRAALGTILEPDSLAAWEA